MTDTEATTEATEEATVTESSTTKNDGDGNGQVVLPSNQVLARKRGETSVFEDIRRKTYKFRYEVTISVDEIVGGTPSDPKVAEGFIKTKLATDRDDLIREMVANTMVERGMDADQAIEEATKNKHLNGFKRLPDGQLCIEGRHVKAMLKEAANIRWPKGRWGESKKGTKGFFAEHVFVEEDAIALGVTEPTRINTRFVFTWRGTGIQLEEIVENAQITFHIVTDHEFSDNEWGQLFVTAEQNGLGAARSQGFGTFAVISFERVNHPRRS